MDHKSPSSPKRKWTIRLVAALVVVAVAIPMGTFIYIHFIEGPPPAKLTLDSSKSSAPAAALSDINGTWVPAEASQVGYRVHEVLFGQKTEAVGRTNRISGNLIVDGKTVKNVDLTVDMTTVTSDQSQRDNQFRNRIMSTRQYPTATYKLTSPIQLSKVPDSTPLTVKASGALTLHGVTKPVTTDLSVRHSSAGVEVSGSIPITFAEWNIPNPTFGPAQTEDHGLLELLVVFVHQ